MVNISINSQGYCNLRTGGIREMNREEEKRKENI